MIDHEIHHELHVPFLEFADELVYIFELAVEGINILVISL